MILATSFQAPMNEEPVHLGPSTLDEPCFGLLVASLFAVLPGSVWTYPPSRTIWSRLTCAASIPTA